MKIVIIGLGGRGQKHLIAALANKNITITGICDPRKEIVDALSTKHALKGFYDVDDLLQTTDADIAIVAVPHLCYLPIIQKLAERKIHILKEKPFAINAEEAKQLEHILKKHQVHMMIACQRRFDLIYQTFIPLLHQIGKIYHIEGHYLMNIPNLAEGWRSSEKTSGGGALIDMGYHFIDLLLWYFGFPSDIKLQKTTGNREGQDYDVEDTVILSFNYRQKFQPTEHTTIGSFTISRTAHKSQEKIIVRGSQGTLILKRDGIYKLNTQGQTQAYLERGKDIFSDPLCLQLQHLCDFIEGKEHTLINHYQDHFKHLELIEAAYGKPQKDYVWPMITEKTKQAVLRQLDTSISIYDRSGIIKIFEDNFAGYHKRQYAVMTNSGTNALFAAYEALNLSTGDEVIAPDYTFFATVTPMLYLGLKPVFCDCLPDGNIDPSEIAKKITPKTKAIVITHLWGVPCDMDKIMPLVKKYNLKLIEDCSHAHGARYRDQLVGTFGDIAVWSLQGQKIITGGEGGILLTDNQDYYARAQLQGHYNKRCKQEIPQSHSLFKFNTTGFGLKTRAHPLAAAIANEQFQHIDSWLAMKQIYAEYIIDGLKEVNFLTPPSLHHKKPAWYALVFQYDEKIAGFPLHIFLEATKALGLTELEQPNSTAPLHTLPLFKHTHEAFPRFYEKPLLPENALFPQAERYYQHAIKLPVWVRLEDKPTVDKYIQGILKATEMLKSQSLKPKL
ncbi:MAG: aminotransferase class I/II-fold pyridoxal phosphate-dependent enzyme [Gammaproteobacteria bacterium]|nr:aminotransferase class I/II-fold pyridoxal phosphate-dependent enzyme [Gammaproteobacteria bacterium]